MPLLAETEAAAARLFGPAHANTLTARANHALALGLTGQVDDALRAADEVLAERREAGLAVVRPLYVAGMLQRLAGSPGVAVDLQREAARLLEARDPSSPELAQVRSEIGLALLAMDSDEAVEPLQQARAVFEATEPHMTPPHADTLIGLGRAYLRGGRPADALPLLEDADRFWRDFGPETRWAGEAAFWTGRCYAALGRSADAREGHSSGRRKRWLAPPCRLMRASFGLLARSGHVDGRCGRRGSDSRVTPRLARSARLEGWPPARRGSWPS